VKTADCREEDSIADMMVISLVFDLWGCLRIGARGTKNIINITRGKERTCLRERMRVKLRKRVS
jgi:hypothetical protein